MNGCHIDIINIDIIQIMIVIMGTRLYFGIFT